MVETMEPVTEQKTEQQLKIELIERRRRRIQRMKRVLTFFLCVLLLFPNVTCVYLLVQNYQMNCRIDAIYKLISEESEKEVIAEDAYANEQIEEIVVSETDAEYLISDNELYPDQKKVYLTFDDGPSKYTDEILDILAEYNVKATFFVLAKDGFDEEYKRIVDEGHTLALHSYSHKYSKIYSSPTLFREDVRLIQDFVRDKTGQKSVIYRFPGGSSNSLVDFDKEELFSILREEELSYFDWNVTSQDAGSVKLSPQKIYQNVMAGVKEKDSGIVLMHDAADKHTTVEALPLILEELTRDDSYVLLPITEGTQPVRHVVSSYE